MDENELDEQFEATDYDEEGNIKLPPPPLAAAKPKRLTVADLKKELNDLKADVDDSVLGWVGELAVRLDKLELELKPQSDQGAKFVWDKIDNQDAAIGALANALRSHIEESAATPQQAKTEMEFAQTPQQMAGGTADISDIGVVAAVCQTMTDVLTITRALKEVPDLTDAERNEILYIAGRASGVIITPGLQIRAGVKFTGA